MKKLTVDCFLTILIPFFPSVCQQLFVLRDRKSSSSSAVLSSRLSLSPLPGEKMRAAPHLTCVSAQKTMSSSSSLVQTR